MFLGINFKNLFTLHFWFNRILGALTPGQTRVYVGIIIISLIFTIVARVMMQLRKGDSILHHIFHRLYRLGITMTILTAMFYFFRYESIPLLSLHFWYLIIFIIGAVWLGFILYELIIKVPKLKSERRTRREFEKYLPGRNQ